MILTLAAVWIVFSVTILLTDRNSPALWPALIIANIYIAIGMAQ